MKRAAPSAQPAGRPRRPYIMMRRSRFSKFRYLRSTLAPGQASVFSHLDLRPPLSMRRSALLLLATLGAAATAACEPTLDQRLSLVEAPRVIAVVSEPAESRPSAPATHRAIIASADGLVTAPVAWAFCTEPKPPTEDNVVNARCLGGAVRELGESPVLSALTPADACMRFGPDVSNGDYRPRDPDITGGYYQPLRLTLPAALGADGAVAFASHRISCNLANAPVEVARAYRERYLANQNPPPAALGRSDGGDSGGDGSRDAAALTARPGEELGLLASWPDGAAEPYVWFDARPALLRVRRESLRVSWYVTGGQLCRDATGRSEDELVAEVAAAGRDEEAPSPPGHTGNCWRAPTTAGEVRLWLVLRDSRGGASVSEHRIVVAP